MSEAKAAEWAARVQETFQALRWADRDVQEQACKSIEKDRGGEEAGAKLRELFEAEHVKVRKLVDKAKAVVAQLPEPVAEPKVEVEFHESDLAPKVAALPTIEEKQRMLEELADLWSADPLRYAEKRREVAERLEVNQVAVDRAVKLVRDERPEEAEQSQVTKVMALGFSPGVDLWHSSDGKGYASVRVDEHWEHYRINSSGFEGWLRTEYGGANRVKLGERWVPQVPGAQAIRDAMASLEGYALRHGETHKVWMRVGGDAREIWIDLGRSDGTAVRVTKEDWDVVPNARVKFVRTGTMLPLPIPRRNGNIRALGRVLNVRAEEFILVPAWLLQVLNPIGDYPFINVHGQSEFGKTVTCNIILRAVDPRTTELRKPKKVEDLLVAARNNWTIGFDNFSWLSKDFSDTLCMIATGISSGSRALYTDDEEHTFTVRRPVIFNGIPGDLIERGDLASRTIKLELPKITRRRTKSDLEAEFERIWPGVFGALLDGLVGGLRDQGSIEVDEPARMMEFEQFAEAGCRAMGFAEWEFVDAYKANRHGSMVAAGEASAVGRAVMEWLKFNPRGFRGQMSVLYRNLGDYKGNASWRDWPGSPTKLSSELKRLTKPLAAIGIICETGVDRRYVAVGGTQSDVILEYTSRVIKVEPVVEPVGVVIPLRRNWRRF